MPGQEAAKFLQYFLVLFVVCFIFFLYIFLIQISCNFCSFDRKTRTTAAAEPKNKLFTYATNLFWLRLGLRLLLALVFWFRFHFHIRFLPTDYFNCLKCHKNAFELFSFFFFFFWWLGRLATATSATTFSFSTFRQRFSIVLPCLWLLSLLPTFPPSVFLTFRQSF